MSLASLHAEYVNFQRCPVQALYFSQQKTRFEKLLAEAGAKPAWTKYLYMQDGKYAIVSTIYLLVDYEGVRHEFEVLNGPMQAMDVPNHKKGKVERRPILSLVPRTETDVMLDEADSAVGC